MSNFVAQIACIILAAFAVALSSVQHNCQDDPAGFALMTFLRSLLVCIVISIIFFALRG